MPHAISPYRGLFPFYPSAYQRSADTLLAMGLKDVFLFTCRHHPPDVQRASVRVPAGRKRARWQARSMAVTFNIYVLYFF